MPFAGCFGFLDSFRCQDGKTPFPLAGEGWDEGVIQLSARHHPNPLPSRARELNDVENQKALGMTREALRVT